MTGTGKRILISALPLALLLAAPAASHAQCSITTGDFDKNGYPDMKIMGTTDPNTLTVNAGPGSTTVSLGPCIGSRTFQGNFYNYGIYLKAKDTINFNVTGNWVGVHRSVLIQLGLGVNKVTIGGTGTMSGGSSLTVSLDGMSGTDTFAVAIPSMDDSYLDVHADLDDNNDSVIVKADKPITGGSVVNIRTTVGDGSNGSGVNTMKFSQTGLVDATLNVDLEGANYADTTTVTLAGPIGPNGRLFLKSDLGEANNVFDGAVSLPLFSIAAGGEVHIDASGRGGTDILTFSRKGSLGGAGTVNAGLLDVRLDGGGGVDTMSVDLAGGGFRLDGTIRLRENGGVGGDRLTALLDVDASSTTPNLDVLLFGGVGSDTLSATINDDGPRTPANYGLAGTAFLDGGLDTNDRCTAAGTAASSGLIHKRNCEL